MAFRQPFDLSTRPTIPEDAIHVCFAESSEDTNWDEMESNYGDDQCMQ